MEKIAQRSTTFGGASDFLNGLIDTLTERGRGLLRRTERQPQGAKATLTTLGEQLLSRGGEALGVTSAQRLLAEFRDASEAERLIFLRSLADHFGPDRRRAELAIEAFRKDDTPGALNTLHKASEPRRQELIRRLNLAPGGTAASVRMRECLLEHLKDDRDLQAADGDFVHLFTSWFNRGFLVLRPIDWTTPANILEKIIRYEAVQAIEDWNDLRNRLEPSDRRCYGFFHPQLVDEPLIFVEVALTRSIPRAVAPLLDLSRVPITAADVDSALFYSISNTQKGLSGVSFGNFLINQVVQDLKRELPSLTTFVTLSPVPGFANWLTRERAVERSLSLDDAAKSRLQLLDEPDWHRGSAEGLASLRDVLLAAAAFYFLKSKTPAGRPVDSVTRFHLGNGARLEHLNFLGDLSPNGLKQSHGLMVNYLYALDDIEKNHEAFVENGVVAASSEVRSALRTDLPSRDLTFVGPT